MCLVLIPFRSTPRTPGSLGGLATREYYVGNLAPEVRNLGPMWMMAKRRDLKHLHSFPWNLYMTRTHYLHQLG